MTAAAQQSGKGLQALQLSCAAYVLAGGRSRRMGQDKALLPIAGGTLLERTVEQASQAAGQVTLVGALQSRVARRHAHHSWIEEHPVSHGPLPAAIAALRHSHSRWNLLLACDMPLVTADFLRSLFEIATACGRMAVVPLSSNFKYHPLCAVYRCDALRCFEAAWDSGERSMMAALRRFPLWNTPVHDSTVLTNVNEWKDWQDLFSPENTWSENSN